MTTEAPTPPGTTTATAAPVSAHSGLASYLLRAAAVNWTANVLFVVYALFITPIVIRALHEELYGVWSFLNGLLAYSNLFYLGLGSAFIKYLAEYRSAGDRQRVNRLASIVFVIYSGIGVLCVALCFLVAPWVPSMFEKPIGDDGTRQAVIACMLLGFRLLFMFVATVYSGVLAAAERIVVANAVTIALTIVRFVAVPVLIRYGRPLVVLAMIVTVTAGIETGMLAWAVRKVTPDVHIRPARPRYPEVRLLYGFGIKSFFILLSAWLVNYTDTTVIGVRLGAAAVAAYVIPLQLVSYGRVAAQGLVSALLPRLAVFQARGDDAGMRETYLRVSRGANYLGAFITFNLVALGPAFISLWVGPELGAVGTTSLFLLAFAGFFQIISTQTTVPFFQATHTCSGPR
jgi:O-antigen/teichoic acid export membrane protein